MSRSDAANYAQILDTRDRVAEDPNRTFYQKVRDLGPLGTALRENEDDDKKQTTFGDILRGAIAAGLGYGLGKGVGSTMGLSDSTTDSLAVTGAMLGGLMGITKSGCTKEEKFRVGFLKSAIDKGYFKEAFIGGLLLDPIIGLSSAGQRIGESAGSVMGATDAPSESDTAIVRDKVETELLRQELERVQSARRTSLLKQVLAKRRQQA